MMWRLISSMGSNLASWELTRRIFQWIGICYMNLWLFYSNFIL